MNTTEALSYNTVETTISNHRLFNFSQDDISLMRDNMFTFFYDLRDLSEKSIVMEIKDEDKAIEAIMQCLEESRIQTDETKKASVIANYR